MPTEVAIFVAAIILIFLVFGATVSWVDHYESSDRLKLGTSKNPKPQKSEAERSV
jgi:hypothetical protein